MKADAVLRVGVCESQILNHHKLQSYQNLKIMSCLGVHFALTEKEAVHLRSLPDDRSRLQHVREVIEESYFREHSELMAESAKSWDALHRTLTDGQISWTGGKYPWSHVVLAGEQLYRKSDYFMSLKTPQQVHDIAQLLPAITESEFRQRYFAIDAKSYGFPLSEEDFGYTWEWFQGVRELYQRAAREGRFVLFTADQ